MQNKKLIATAAAGMIIGVAVSASADEFTKTTIAKAQYEIGLDNEKNCLSDVHDQDSCLREAYICYRLSAAQSNADAAEGLKRVQARMSQEKISYAETLLRSGAHCELGDAGDDECFITTAVCAGLGRPDDCRELQVLRWFRDNVLACTRSGRRDIAVYYEIAPRVVAAISGCADSETIYRALLDKHIRPAITAVESREYERAHNIYKSMTLELERLYL